MDDLEIINEALRIVELARDRGIVLRILGAIAIRLHSEGYQDLHKRLNRLGDRVSSFTDIDLIGYSSQRRGIRKLMEKDLNFQIPRHFLFLHGKERLIYTHSERHYQVDIFLDKLSFSHDIFFGKKPGKGRLELDYPTIPLSELLLEKLQIHEINEKDIKDVIVLLRAHSISHSDKRDTINIEYITNILSNDWEFWYDVKTNLDKVFMFAEKYAEDGLLSSRDLEDISNKIHYIISCLDRSPKTKKWLKRAKVGTRKKWWRDVEEVFR